MVIACAVDMALFLNPSLELDFVATNPETIKLASLGVVATISSILGIHLTGSIGGADMAVVSTVLNSCSAWALCAEDFLLGNPLLAQAGTLIGFSGSILTWMMCETMGKKFVVTSSYVFF